MTSLIAGTTNEAIGPESPGQDRVPDWPGVSVLIPARNDQEALVSALHAVLAQDYDGAMEIIVAEGSDTPATAEAIGARFPGVRVIPNPERNTPSALNHALRAATHSVIVRCDSHCVLPAHYVRRAVSTLRRTRAANVGGRQCPAGTTRFERAVALAMTTPLGAGDARYRLGGPEGPVDTVFLGVFRRDALTAAGGFDATLDRNQDYDLNWRLRRRGETVWFDPALEVTYRPRGTLAALARQYFDYGWWKRIVLRRHPASLRYRQLAAPILVPGLAVSAFLAGLVTAGLADPAMMGAAALAPLAYLLLILAGSAVVCLRRRHSTVLLLALVLAVMHLSWGAGFWCASVAGRR